MGNSAVSHCRFPALGNISGQLFRNHRCLITPDPVSEPPPGQATTMPKKFGHDLLSSG